MGAHAQVHGNKIALMRMSVVKHLSRLLHDNMDQTPYSAAPPPSPSSQDGVLEEERLQAGVAAMRREVETCVPGLDEAAGLDEARYYAITTFHNLSTVKKAQVCSMGTWMVHTNTRGGKVPSARLGAHTSKGVRNPRCLGGTFCSITAVFNCRLLLGA